MAGTPNLGVADTISVGGVDLHVMIGRPNPNWWPRRSGVLPKNGTVLGILSIVLFACVGLFAEFGIRSQIGRIAKMAARLGAGDLTARVAPPYPRGELGSLMTVLNHTASSLEIQRRDIEDLNARLQLAQELEAVEKQRLDTAVNNMTQGLILYRRIGTRRGLQPQLHRNDGHVAGRMKPGCTFPRRDRAPQRDRIARLATSRNIATTFLAASRLATSAPIVDHRRRALDPGRRPGRSRAAAGSPRVEDITERMRADRAHRAYGALRCADRSAQPRAVPRAPRPRPAELSPGRQLAVLYIDIDEFKGINDLLGHAVGDELLKAVASRLRACVAAERCRRPARRRRVRDRPGRRRPARPTPWT